jgi:hypothetical protein
VFDWMKDKDHPMCYGAGFGLAFLGIALVVSSFAWPLAWYNVSVTQADRDMHTKMAEAGYEQVAERPDARSDVRLTWRKVNEARK